MVKRYTFGNPFNTESVVAKILTEKDQLPYFSAEVSEKIDFSLDLEDSDIVYGLGQAIRGINKRGWIYESFCSDDPFHTEDKSSLYGAHNFIIVDSKKPFGVYFDYPGKMIFDIGYTVSDKMTVSAEKADLDVYIIEENSPYAIVKEFRKIIGQSYIPPIWGFGFQQCRWSYKDQNEIEEIAKGYKEAKIPLDSIYMDIDYMVDFKDFTVDEKKFPKFKSFVKKIKENGIRLVPIIDAGVKVEDGYDVYEEGIKNNYFCKDKEGNDFLSAVWPGLTHFPDFLNPEARKWFGEKYKTLTDCGIEGFWNDMNEPAIFFSDKRLKEAFKKIKEHDEKIESPWDFFELKDSFAHLANSKEDYQSFYHNVDGKSVCHYDVHNLYGYNMTKSAADALNEEIKDKRTLLFSRASFIGMHRCSGIWTGDNHSWWGHILNQIKVMPSLNMCGFLYSGADLGGFNGNCTEDLLLRWTALGVFTPLFRNHSAIGTRNQEFFRFEHTDWFKNFVEFRYRLIPYIYSEFIKAALNNDMFFRPLAFDYPKDAIAKQTEDQLMVGGNIMIAPVYTQNATGRYVYIPENMTKIRLKSNGKLIETLIKSGHHYIEVPLDEIVFFIKYGEMVPLCDSAKNTDSLNKSITAYLGTGDEYKMYSDDGYTKDISEKNIEKIKRPATEKKRYSLGEEIFNAVTHGVGSMLSIAGMIVLIIFSAIYSNTTAVVSSAIYGSSLVILYTMSTLYHSITNKKAKKFFRIMDHNTIFFLIAGTYTPITLAILGGQLGWTLFFVVWVAAAIGIIFNSIDLERFAKPSVVCYIAMGWVVVFAIKPMMDSVPPLTLIFLLLGGAFYTLGVIFYAIKKVKYFHSVWHIFVVMGSLFHYFSILNAILYPIV